MSPRQFYTDRDGCLRRAEDDALTLPLTYSRRQLLVKTGALGLGALSAGSLIEALLPSSAEAASNLGLTLRQAAAGGTLVFAVGGLAQREAEVGGRLGATRKESFDEGAGA